MISENFVIVGAILNFIGGLHYLIATLRGEVRPNKVTWFLWSLAPLIAFYSEIKQGVGITALMTFMVGFNPLLIFLASFVNKKSEWKLGPLDIICGTLSVAGLALWYLTKIGNVAIGFSILADGLAAIPTIVKSYRMPETENYLIFFFGALSAAITLLTINIWKFEYFGFPMYILIANLILTIIIKFKPGKRIHNL